MEHLCAVLTAVLLNLFLFYCLHGRHVRARRKAGRLMLRIERPRLYTYGTWLPVCVLGIAWIVFAWLLLEVMDRRLMTSWMTFFFLHLTLQMLFLVWAVGTQRLELREHGLVAFFQGPIVFAPWHFITYCQWKRDRKRLLVECPKRKREYATRPEQVDEVNAILSQYVEVRGEDGTVAADGSRQRNPADDEDPPEPEIRRLQFRLRTLLLFMLVCSAAFGWLGVRMRSWDQQRQAIAQFEEMQPSVTYLLNDVFQLDFSACKIKPTDNDLAHLSKCPRLWNLNLSGAPITDAGLKHLEGLTSLQFVSLHNTKVTNEGVEKLERALPHTAIGH